jgi:magnesium chelatase subunit D
VNHHLYPFCAIVGQERAKRAVLLNLITPRIGGLLLSGEKGTAKSTLLRAAAALLPNLKTVNLPLNASEDGVMGCVDFERTIKAGEFFYSPGVLAKADGNILYIDEVNLLDRSLSAMILDAAACGECRIEREGHSHTVPSRFILFGSMNPEEGAVHPQLLDRFGLFVRIEGEQSPERRAEIIRRRLEFERDSAGFIHAFTPQERRLTTTLKKARKMFDRVTISPDLLSFAAACCTRAHLTGHRGDIILATAARGIAALEQREMVTRDDILDAAAFVFPHRIPEEPTSSVSDAGETEPDRFDPEPQAEQIEQDDPQITPEKDDGGDGSTDGSTGAPVNTPADHHPDLPPDLPGDTPADMPPPSLDETGDRPDAEDGGKDRIFDIEGTFLFPEIRPLQDRRRRNVTSPGRRERVRTDSKRGRYVRSRRHDGRSTDIAIDATIRAAISRQFSRPEHGRAIIVHPEDLRIKMRRKRIGNTVLFLVDGSGSMGAAGRMAETKGAVFSMLRESYRRRDRVGMMIFRRDTVALILQPTRSIELAYARLKEIPVGGATPLALGLMEAGILMRALAAKEDGELPVLVLLTDGRGNVPLPGNKDRGKLGEKSGAQTLIGQEISRTAGRVAAEGARILVVDTETGWVRLNLAQRLAEELKATYLRLDEFRADSLAESVTAFVG